MGRGTLCNRGRCRQTAVASTGEKKRRKASLLTIVSPGYWNMRMHDTTENALVEISLALAMAFFALLVVALVSITAPDQQPAEKPVNASTVPEGFDLTAEAPNRLQNKEADPRILLHYQGRWFDLAGDPLDPALLSRDARNLVVALSPDLTLADAQKAQEAVRHIDANPTLTTLSHAWVRRLESYP